MTGISLHVLAIATLGFYALCVALSLSALVSTSLYFAKSLRIIKALSFILLVGVGVCALVTSPVNAGIYYLVVAVLLEGFILARIVNHPFSQFLVSGWVLILLGASFYLIHQASTHPTREVVSSIYLYSHIVVAAGAEGALIGAGIMSALFFWMKRKIKKKELSLVLDSHVSLTKCASLARVLSACSFLFLKLSLVISHGSLLNLLISGDISAWSTLALCILLAIVISFELLPPLQGYLSQSKRLSLILALSIMSIVLIILRISFGADYAHRGLSTFGEVKGDIKASYSVDSPSRLE